MLDRAELEANATAFQRQGGMPKVAALVDGSLVLIKSPPLQDEAAYVDRNGNHSLNVQVQTSISDRFD